MKSKEMFSNYSATDDGIVLNKDGEPVKTFKSNNYWQCCIFDNDGKKYTMGVHSVVAMLNIDDWYDGCIVHHKDGNCHNNAVDNLEIMSRRQHALLHYEKGELHDVGKYIKEHYMGENSYCSKKVYCVELNQTFGALHEAERKTGVHNGKISMCCNGKRKTAGGYHWKFV
jgi:hypothetical protein